VDGDGYPEFAREAFELVLHGDAPDAIEAGGERASLLQEDDGLTLAALAGACRRTTLTLARSGDEIVLDAEVEGDGYAEFAREAFELVLHGEAPGAVEVDGERVALREGRARVANAGAAFSARWRAG